MAVITDEAGASLLDEGSGTILDEAGAAAVDVTVTIGPTTSRAQAAAGSVQGDGKPAGNVQGDGKSVGPTVIDRTR